MNWLSFLANSATWASIGTIVGALVAAFTKSMSWPAAVAVIMPALSALLAALHGKATVNQLRSKGLIR